MYLLSIGQTQYEVYRWRVSCGAALPEIVGRLLYVKRLADEQHLIVLFYIPLCCQDLYMSKLRKAEAAAKQEQQQQEQDAPVKGSKGADGGGPVLQAASRSGGTVGGQVRTGDPPVAGGAVASSAAASVKAQLKHRKASRLQVQMPANVYNHGFVQNLWEALRPHAALRRAVKGEGPSRVSHRQGSDQVKQHRHAQQVKKKGL